MRARPLDTLLAGFAVLVAAWPLSTLLVRQTWVMPTIAILLLVGVIGVLGRSQRWPAVVTVAAQVLAALLALNWLFHLGDGPYGLPTWTLPTHVSDLVTQGLRTMANYAAPAPATPGLVFLLVVMVSAFAVVVDLLAVELRSPALAGFPLLIIFMISVVNTGDALPVRYFAVLAIVWLLLVAQHNTGQLGHWVNTAVRRYEPGRGDAVGLGRFTDRARVAAVVAVLLALGAQSVLPDVPTRFLIPGLGRADSAAQGARGPISFSSSVDLDRSLRDRSDRPVLVYKTNAPQPPPLAVAVSTGYENGRWFGDRATPPGLDDLDRGQQPQRIAEGVRTVVRQFSAAGNQVSSPQLAVPGDVVQADVDARWRKDEVTGIVRVSRQAQTYRLIYREPAPTPAQLAVTRADAERSGIPLPDVYGGDLLELDPASAPLVRRTADEIVAGGVNGGPATTAYDKALAIQQYLRSNRFSYSLTLAPPQPREPGNPGAGTLDPISNFLTTRQGYCTQFATSMIMMARSQGIPARLVLGFLPGSYSPRTASYTVVAGDAHAWPEVYLAGVGWTRFEPTPSGRSGTAPGWAVPTATPTATPTPTPTTASPRAQQPTAPQEAPTTSTSTWDSVRDLFTPMRLILLGSVLAVLALLALTPVTAALVRRRRREQARSEAERVEAQWLTLREQLDDLGLGAPAGLTPRTLADHYRSVPGLDAASRDGLATMLATVERVRYAPTRRVDHPSATKPSATDPNATVPSRTDPSPTDPHEVADQADEVRSRVARTRSLPVRLRAALLPTTGLQVLSRARWRVYDALTDPLRRR